jgi:hypothetical protein
MTEVSNTQLYPEEHTTAIDKKPGILIAWAAVVLTYHKSKKDYPPLYVFCHI